MSNPSAAPVDAELVAAAAAPNDDDNESHYAQLADLERRLEALKMKNAAKPCQRSDCIRARALLRVPPPPPQYIGGGSSSVGQWERRRAGTLSVFWVACLVVSLAWCVWCVQRKAVGWAVLNFMLAFLPLWRRVYVDTPLHWTAVSLGVMGATWWWM